LVTTKSIDFNLHCSSDGGGGEEEEMMVVVVVGGGGSGRGLWSVWLGQQLDNNVPIRIK